MADRMSQEAQERILSVLDRASDHVETGLFPDEALAKAAAEKQLPAGHVQLIVQAFNTGRASYHRKIAQTTLEKAAVLPLASTDGVLSRLYPELPEKSAATRYNQVARSQDYASPPPQFPPSETWTKSASETVVVSSTEPRSATDPKRAFGLLRDADQSLLEGKVEVEFWRQKLASTLHALDDVFRQGTFSWPEVCKNFVAARGSVAGVLCAQLERHAHPKLLKQAQSRPRQHQVYDETRSPYRELAGCYAALEGFRQAEQKVKAFFENPQLQKLASQLRPWFKFAEEKSDQKPAKPDGPGKSLLSGVWSDLKGSPGATFQGAVSGLLQSRQTLGKPVVEWATASPAWAGKDDKALETLLSPEHELELRQIRTKAMLHDLLANDPILSEHQPEEVVSAFNELQRLAPRLLAEPAVVRTLLRKHLAQGGIDTHELKQLGDSELALRRSRELPINAPEAAQPVVGAGRGYQNKQVKLPKTLLQSVLAE